MKTVFSLKVPSRNFSLLNILELYKLCQSCSSDIYIYAKDKSCMVERLPSLVSFVISLHCRNLVIVIEGEHSMEDKVLLERC
ncbi:hypothetical protein ACJROX_27160 [Pseudalkalibacillus sp. A8]|uniref:hypothetical protein n=1 Tax=Pseudalkalibacillus sp. A8 TaxID=3382641 RepID=UPI0038B6043E